MFIGTRLSWIFLGYLVIQVSCSPNDDTWSIPHGERIVGGDLAYYGEIPWQVSIQDNTRHLYCGGVIISNEWILTAAHCSFVDPANYRVVSGTLEFKTNGTVHIISEVQRHAEYDSTWFTNDIAAWKVDPPFVWDEQTAPLILPSQGVPTEEGTNVTVSGWGDKKYGGQLSEELLVTTIPIVSKSDCNRDYLQYGGIRTHMICAGLPEGGKAPCQGDSGGPVTVDGELRGLVSWAVGCAWEGYPAVFTEVSGFRDWITEHTGI